MAKRLLVRDPVPSDIEIAQSLEPLPITEIAESVGLSPEDYITYGPTKAKVGGTGAAAGQAVPVGMHVQPALPHPPSGTPS